MKIRSGFVSNSSSSSFCIMGTYIGDDHDTYEQAYDTLQDTDLDIECAVQEYDDSVYVGLLVEKMGEDETKAQFRQRVVDALKGTPYESNKVNWITDGGYNG